MKPFPVFQGGDRAKRQPVVVRLIQTIFIACCQDIVVGLQSINIYQEILSHWHCCRNQKSRGRIPPAATLA